MANGGPLQESNSDFFSGPISSSYFLDKLGSITLGYIQLLLCKQAAFFRNRKYIHAIWRRKFSLREKPLLLDRFFPNFPALLSLSFPSVCRSRNHIFHYTTASGEVLLSGKVVQSGGFPAFIVHACKQISELATNNGRMRLRRLPQLDGLNPANGVYLRPLRQSYGSSPAHRYQLHGEFKNPIY